MLIISRPPVFTGGLFIDLKIKCMGQSKKDFMVLREDFTEDAHADELYLSAEAAEKEKQILQEVLRQEAGIEATLEIGKPRKTNPNGETDSFLDQALPF
jgi:hypothetical protein